MAVLHSAPKFAIGLILASGMLSAPLSAQDAEPVTWSRAQAIDGQFSAETPCTPEELAERAMLPGNGTSIGPMQSRILCIHRGVMLTASIRTVSEKDDETGSAFDYMLGDIEARSADGAAPAIIDIAGKRAISNDETKEGRYSRTLIVDVAPNSLLILIAGGPFEDGAALEEVPGMVSRFVDTLEIAS